MNSPKNSLFDTKRRISNGFLGKAGVHGVGLHPTRKETIIVYKNNDNSEETETLLTNLNKAAGPFDVEIVEEDAPVMTSTPPLESDEPRSVETSSDNDPSAKSQKNRS